MAKVPGARIGMSVVVANNIAPTREIANLLTSLAQPYEARIFPAWGVNANEAHRFASAGSQIWGPYVQAFLAKYL